MTDYHLRIIEFLLCQILVVLWQIAGTEMIRRYVPNGFIIAVCIGWCILGFFYLYI